MDNIYKINLNNTYGWFSSTIEKSVESSLSDFFENLFNIKLVSISENSKLKTNPLLRGNLFYICRISIKNKQSLLVRLSSDFIRIVFHDIFGSSSPVFNIEKLTELEQMIINSAMEYVAKSIEEFLISDVDKNKIDPKNKEELTLVFLIKSKGINAGKLCITFPLNRLNPIPIKKEINFNYDDFINCSTTVNLIAGSARISLEELSNLTLDDILVLENSNLNKMTLKTPYAMCDFKVKPNTSLMLYFDDDNEDVDIQDNDSIEYDNKNKEINMFDKSVWDDIQIDVNAEFRKIKMPLGALKQISKDLVVDLGPIMENEITLLVENKIVAKGELVIINDKYAVRIKEVYANHKKSEIIEENKKDNQEEKNKELPKNKTEEQSSINSSQNSNQESDDEFEEDFEEDEEENKDNENSEDDEFDYSDFEE